MKHVYFLIHENEDSNTKSDVKIIGAFSKKKKARKVRDSLLDAPGFKNSPKGFVIAKYKLDKFEWSNGFISLGGGLYNAAANLEEVS